MYTTGRNLISFGVGKVNNAHLSFFNIKRYVLTKSTNKRKLETEMSLSPAFFVCNTTMPLNHK